MEAMTRQRLAKEADPLLQIAEVHAQTQVRVPMENVQLAWGNGVPVQASEKTLAKAEKNKAGLVVIIKSQG